jgi:hypothetical protein
LYHIDNNIGADGAKSIANALMINQSIANMDLYSMNTTHHHSLFISYLFLFLFQSHLHYTGNNIGSDGAESIADALKINQSISTMNLMSMNTTHHPLLN